MNANAILQISFYFFVLTAFSLLCGHYIARVFQNKSTFSSRLLKPIEKSIYKFSGIDPKTEMTWREYAFATLNFSMVSLIALYALQRLQSFLPFNPTSLGPVASDTAFNTAMSFVTNTNWQSYGGETTMSYLTQMLGLSVQNFVSAAVGVAVLFALIRGFIRKNTKYIGNFWVDLTQSTLYILLPFAFVFAILLIWQGVPQTFSNSKTSSLLEPLHVSDGTIVEDQTLPVGPVASQIAIKQLGTNGGGYYNVNSAHPFENPTPLTNFLECIAILLLAGALCFTFGEIVGNLRQGWVLYGAMSLIFLLMTFPCAWFEQNGNPVFNQMGIEQTPNEFHGGGNMEGKEVRNGAIASALWATATTAASNGSVNSMHDSFTPLGGLFPMLLIQLGEVVYGGVGSGLYGMLAFAVLTVFIAGLMVGRTPEYLGKKIGSFEMKMVSLIILIPCALALTGTAIGVSVSSVRSSITNPGPHGLSQVLYAYSSMANNNGSAFGGFGAGVPLHNYLGGVVMWLSRVLLIVLTLGLAGSLAEKKSVPPGPGTLKTDTILFTLLLLGVVLLVGALTFVPALALGPIIEHLNLYRS